MTSPIDVVGTVTLTPAQAHQVWNWTLSRQGLHPDLRLTSVTQVADAALGLHAARLPSPYATVLARTRTPDIALDLLRPRTGQPPLITLRCMRKTLHTLPPHLAGPAHTATVHYRLRDAERLALTSGIPVPVLDAATRAVLAVLADGPLHHRAIETALTGTHGARPRPTGPPLSVTAVRVALKLAWERGTLTYLNRSGCWNTERRTFALTASAHPTLGLADVSDPAGVPGAADVDARRAATRALVVAYFDRYGPATVQDVMWWAALSRTAVTTAMNHPTLAWVEVHTPWATAPAYLPAHRWEAFTTTDPATHTTGLNLLAHEDVALKAYAQTRARYLHSLHPRQAFNQIGEALPTILVNGHVHGTWAWDTRTRSVTPHLARGRTTRALTAAVTALTDALHAGWRDPTRTPRLPDPTHPDQAPLTPVH